MLTAGCGQLSCISLGMQHLGSVSVKSSRLSPRHGLGGFPESTVTSLLVTLEMLGPHCVQACGEGDKEHLMLEL